VEQLSSCGSGGPSIDRERGRESPTGRRCTFWPREIGKHLSTGWCGPFEDISASGTEISEKICACSRRPASRDKGAWQRILRGRKVFTEAQLTECSESEERFARSVARLSRQRCGHEGNGCLRILGVGGRRIGIKASRPLDVDTSLLSSLSDCLKESCVLVTKLSLLLYSILSRSSTLSLDLSSHSISFSHSRARGILSRTCSIAK
jgi:hypothetical protein